MPPLIDALQLDVQREVKCLVGRATIPKRVRRLLCLVITCNATAAMQVCDMIRGGKKIQAPKWVTQELRRQAVNRRI